MVRNLLLVYGKNLIGAYVDYLILKIRWLLNCTNKMEYLIV